LPGMKKTIRKLLEELDESVEVVRVADEW